MKKIVFILLFSFISLFAFEELNANNFDEKIKGKKVVVNFHQVW
jgi:thioredoxin 1